MAKLNIDLKEKTKAKIAKDAGKRPVKEYVLEKLGVLAIENGLSMK